MPSSMCLLRTAPAIVTAILAVASPTRAKDIGVEEKEPQERTAPVPPAPVTPALIASAPPNDAEPVASAPPTDVAESPASTSSPASTFDVRRLALEGHLGIGTPVGSLGAVLEYAPLPFLGLGAGLGVGSGPSSGNHFHGAVVARFRPARGPKDALVIGLGYSFGGYQRFHLNIDGDPSNDALQADWAHWAQADIGWERRTPKGFLIRLSMGGAALLNPASLRCDDAAFSSSCRSASSEGLFTFDLALGYAGPL
jgi:hypothetical protein